MPTNSKPGLADLKWLRQQAEAASDPAPAPALPKKRHRYRQRDNAAHNEKTAAPQPQNSGAVSPVGKNTDQAPPSSVAAEDKALFRRAVASVHPLPPSNRAILPPVQTAPLAILKQKRHAAAGLDATVAPPLSDHYAPAHLAADASHFVQAGHGADLLKKLTQGKWPIGASLDLHGSTLDEARLRLDGFLRSCLEHQIKCVRIVHGKGHGSKNNAPVLKDTVRRWLTQLEDVMAYVECSEPNGGAGAVQVLLKTNQNTKTSRPTINRRP